MKKIISYCLWGDNPKYNIGAIRNAELARGLFPDWTTRFYVGESVPWKTIEALIDPVPKQYSRYKLINGRFEALCGSFNPLIEIYHMDCLGDWRMMLTRFMPITEDNVEIFLSRDCDSRLSLREKIVVESWLNSDKGVLCLGQHPWHTLPMMGGGWGMKQDVLPSFKYLLENYISKNEYQTDQLFLNNLIWSKIKDKTLLIHDFYAHLWNGQKWPIYPPDNIDFFGQVFDENNKPIQEHLDVYYATMDRRRN